MWQYYADWANDRQPQRSKPRFGNARLQEGSDILDDPSADFSTLSLEQISTLHVGHFYKGGDKPSKADRGGQNAGVYRVVEIIDRTKLRVSPPFKQNADAPYSIGTHHYFDRVVGNCHFFFIDTRSERTEFKGAEYAYDENSSILGTAQKEWLKEKTASSKADFLFIVSGDPWVIYHSAFHVRGTDTDTKGDGFSPTSASGKNCWSSST